MNQQTFSSQGVFERYGRKSRRELFLDEMEQVVPWATLAPLVEPHYAKAGNGRQPVGLSIMLRIHFAQQWFNLSDPGVEEALYDSAALRRFAGVDLGRAAAPDETTICRFRHLLERHQLGGEMLERVNQHLEAHGIKIATGTIVDATIIHATILVMHPRHAPSSCALVMRLRRPRTPPGSATPRCTRPGRAASGTSV